MLKIGMILCVTSISLTAQWANRPAPGLARMPDGKPNLSAPVPRTRDGKPDLSGLYEADSARLFQNIAADFKAGDFPILRSFVADKSRKTADCGSRNIGRTAASTTS